VETRRRDSSKGEADRFVQEQNICARHEAFDLFLGGLLYVVVAMRKKHFPNRSSCCVAGLAAVLGTVTAGDRKS
jgi:hypothetical protein